MNIPENMGNEESKLVANMVVKQREADIAMAKLYAAKNRYRNWLFPELANI